jgi:hypothetical protein
MEQIATPSNHTYIADATTPSKKYNLSDELIISINSPKDVLLPFLSTSRIVKYARAKDIIVHMKFLCIVFLFFIFLRSRNAVCHRLCLLAQSLLCTVSAHHFLL